MENNKIIKILIIVAIITIILDQFSKIIVMMTIDKELIIIPESFSIVKLENEGIAFGLNKQNLFNIFLTTIILSLIITYMFKQKTNMNIKRIIFLSLIVGGGIGNLIDRIFKGAVFDFIKLGSFPVFNFADCFITIGWILFVIDFLFITSIEFKTIFYNKNPWC